MMGTLHKPDGISLTSEKKGRKKEKHVCTIVSKGDWLGNPAKIKVENNGAVGYVGSFLTVHDPLFSVHKL